MRGFLVSFGIHAAGVVGLLVLPAFSASELPPPPRPPVIDAWPTPTVRLPTVARLLPPPRSGGGGGTRALTPPAPAVPATATGLSEDAAALLAPEPGTQCCEPGIEQEGDGIAVGPGPLSLVAASPAPTLVRAGGDIRPPRKLAGANPVYPESAKAARIQGIVILECTIGPDGRVSAIRVLKGQPLLEGAAVAAVEGWSYTPTLLNGVPVSVLMTVTVEFKLSR